MANRLIAQDALVTIYDGGAYAASGPTYATGIPVQAFAKSIKIDDKVNLVDLRGWGDARAKKRPTYGETTITLEIMIENSGKVAVANGNFGKIVFTPISGGTAETYEGIWANFGTDASLDNAQMQTLVLECDADNV